MIHLSALVRTQPDEKLLVLLLLTQKWAIVLTSNVFSISESGASMNFFPVTIPALFTKMLTSPASRFTCMGRRWSTRGRQLQKKQI